MLTECSDSPLQTWRTASSVAPTTWALARCMSVKTGSSSVPRPRAGSVQPGVVPALVTASIRASSCTVAICSELAIGASTRLTPSSTPSSSASRMVRSTRTGDIGCVGPKL